MDVRCLHWAQIMRLHTRLIAPAIAATRRTRLVLEDAVSCGGYRALLSRWACTVLTIASALARNSAVRGTAIEDFQNISGVQIIVAVGFSVENLIFSVEWRNSIDVIRRIRVVLGYSSAFSCWSGEGNWRCAKEGHCDENVVDRDHRAKCDGLVLDEVVKRRFVGLM
jgi:hypothetical protein